MIICRAFFNQLRFLITLTFESALQELVHVIGKKVTALFKDT